MQLKIIQHLAPAHYNSYNRQRNLKSGSTRLSVIFKPSVGSRVWEPLCLSVANRKLSFFHFSLPKNQLCAVKNKIEGKPCLQVYSLIEMGSRGYGKQGEGKIHSTIGNPYIKVVSGFHKYHSTYVDRPCC